MVTRIGVTALAAVALTMGCSLVNAPSSHTRGRGEVAVDAGLPAAPQLRLVHLARDTGSIDLYVNDQMLAADLPFAEVSQPGEVEEGLVALRVNRAGTMDVLAEGSFELDPSREYTLTLHGDEEEAPFERQLDLLILNDDASGLDTVTKIRLAVVHVATPVVAGQLVAVGPGGMNTLLADDFGFTAVALLSELDSKEYVVGFDAGANGIVDLTFDLPSLVPGTYANVFVATRPDDSVFLLVNTQLGATLEIDANP